MKIKKIMLLLLAFPMIIILSGCDMGSKIEIGILQFLEHPALSEARKGFIDGLAEAGYVDGENIKVRVLNPETDAVVMSTNSKQLVRRSDLILAIATPAAISVVNEAKDQKKDTPILFTAVTDPVDAKLIVSLEQPGANVTGTNDMNPIKEQIELIKRMMPDSKKLGILYTSSETNSSVQAKIAEDEAKKYGLEVIIKTIATVTDLQLVANQLTNEVDVLYIPTDNVISASMNSLSEILINKKVPAVVGEANMVHNGGSITYGIDYYKLGKETANMAIKILRDNVKPKDIPCVSISEYSLIINKKQFDQMGIILPEDLLASADEILR